MIVGVSRAKQFLACPLQWWLGNVAEVPLPHSYGQVFGNVLHACVERWLKEEDPFPPGWQWCAESRQRVERSDDDMIQAMVAQAVEKGYLRRHPERRVEHTWWTTIKERATDDPFGAVLIAKGTTDLSEPGVIVDHKGSKNVAYYAKTKAELRTDLQLLVYLYVNEISRGIKHKDTDLLTVGHINYCRATGEVSEKTVRVKWADAVAAWTSFRTTAERMLPIAAIHHIDQVPCAMDNPPREDGKRACDDYGGCGYAAICTSKNKEAAFQKFRTRQLRASLPPQAREDFQRSIDEMVNNKVKAATKKPGRVVEPEDDEDEAPAPKKGNPFRASDADEDDEDEVAPAPKKRPKPVPVDETEDEEPEEEPAPAPKKRAKAAPVDETEDEEEEPAPVEDEEDEEPAPAPKKRAKAAPVEDEEEEVVKPEKVPAGGARASEFVVNILAKNNPRVAKVLARLRNLDQQDLANRLAIIYCEILGMSGTEGI